MLSISPIYCSVLIVLIIFLAYRVTVFRREEKIGLGDSESSKAMKSAIRAHANAIENIPVALILLVMLELNHLTPWLLHAFGLVLVVGRGAHAWGLSKKNGPSPGRYYGTLFTWLCIALMAFVNVLLVASR